MTIGIGKLNFHSELAAPLRAPKFRILFPVYAKTLHNSTQHANRWISDEKYQLSWNGDDLFVSAIFEKNENTSVGVYTWFRLEHLITISFALSALELAHTNSSASVCSQVSRSNNATESAVAMVSVRTDSAGSIFLRALTGMHVTAIWHTRVREHHVFVVSYRQLIDVMWNKIENCFNWINCHLVFVCY